jgi:hypothetical protein
MAKGREGAGGALTRAILEGLPPGVELDEREQALLAMGSRQADDIAALEADIADRGHVIVGRLNPAVPEARQGRTARGRLLSGISMPESQSFTALRARRPRTRAGRNRRPRDARLIALDANQTLALLIGPTEGDGLSDDDLQLGWRLHGAGLMEDHAAPAGTRPWGWWRFVAGRGDASRAGTRRP